MFALFMLIARGVRSIFSPGEEVPDRQMVELGMDRWKPVEVRINHMVFEQLGRTNMRFRFYLEPDTPHDPLRVCAHFRAEDWTRQISCDNGVETSEPWPRVRKQRQALKRVGDLSLRLMTQDGELQLEPDKPLVLELGHVDGFGRLLAPSPD